MAIQVYTKTGFFDMPAFEVTALNVNGMPWLKSKEVASCLGYANTTQAVRHNVDDEDKKTYEELGQGGLWHSLPSNQQLCEVYINESGLYS